MFVGLLLALAGSVEDTGRVSLWITGVPFSEVVREATKQSGRQVTADEGLGGVRVSVYCTGVRFDDLISAASVALDAKVARSQGAVALSKDDAVWSAKAALEPSLITKATRLLTRLRDAWLQSAPPADELAHRARQEERMRARRYNRNDYELSEDERRFRASAQSEQPWPFAYLLSRLSDAEFAAFLDGEPLIASNTPVPGVPQVSPAPPERGEQSPMCWTFLYEPEEYRVRWARHDKQGKTFYSGYSDWIQLVEAGRVEGLGEPYEKILDAQRKQYAPFSLEQMERDPFVRSLVDGRTEASVFLEAVARSGRPIFALAPVNADFRSMPDLAVMVSGIVAVKPRLHWTSRFRATWPQPLPIEDYADPVRTFDHASRVVLELGRWALDHDEVSPFSGMYPSAGKAFALFWQSLTEAQKRRVFAGGLPGSDLTQEQSGHYRRAVYGGLYNSSGRVFPLEHLAPHQLGDSSLKIVYEACFGRSWKNKSDGSSNGSMMSPIRYGDWKVETETTVATSVFVGGSFQLKLINGDTEVVSQHGTLVTAIATGGLGELRRAVDDIRRRFGQPR